MRVLILLLVILLSVGAGRVPVEGDRWPQFRGDPMLNGVSSSAVPDTLKLLWTCETGDAVESSAAIAESTVYVGSQSSNLLAVDLSNGKVKWRYKVKDGVGESSPAVAERHRLHWRPVGAGSCSQRT